MISETYFSSNYTSVWRSLTPSMEDFVRRWNMDGYHREWIPIPTLSDGDRRGIVNEAGFILFSWLISEKRSDAIGLASGLVQRAFERAAAYVYGSDSASEHSDFSTAEKREAIVIAGRLHFFFEREKAAHDVTVSPKFGGSGVISSCTGDVLVGFDTLYEVKSGDRKFRSVDYRQLAVYAALNFGSTGLIIKNLGIVNPRTGITVSVDTDEFAREVSGQSAASLFQTLIEAFSSNLVSL